MIKHFIILVYYTLLITSTILYNQIKNSLEKKFNLSKIIIAYEPVWSIGTGKTPKFGELLKVICYIKTYIKKQFRTKKYPKVLYGGSVNDKNIKEFSKQTNFSRIQEIDGFLIGGASQSSKKFIDIIRNYYK